MSVARELRFRGYNTRRNLPPASHRKRGEANFLGAFVRSFLKRVEPPFVYGRHFAMPGCGIADFILYQLSPELGDPIGRTRGFLIAIETKLSDWRRALQQAYRYRYYADLAVVLLPRETGSRALACADLFQRLGVALWTFDRLSGKIEQHVALAQDGPLNPARHDEALALIGRRIGNLRGGEELPQAFLERV